MFMLAPDIDDARGRVTLWSASAALGIAVAGGFAAVLVEISLAVVLATALVLATLALALSDAKSCNFTAREGAAALN